MALTRSSPEDRQRPALAGVLLPPAAMAACVAVAAATVSAAARMPVIWCGVAATALVAALAAQSARRGLALAAVRGRQAEFEADMRRRLAEQEAATIRLAEVVLPDAIRLLQLGESVDEVLDATHYDLGLAPAARAAHDAVLRSVLDAVRAEEDLRDSAQRAFVNIARRVQAIVHQQFQDLRAMEDRHGGDSGVFGDLLHLDHGTALIGRLADSIAVLGGSRPGRQWQQNVPLFSVLRGAMSRISDYQRVELHSVLEVAVFGPAVEPLIHALAELLDNATRYSPPHTRVHLTATEVQSGVAVEIEDGGVGLSEEARIRAERVLSHVSAGLDLADLGETPRLGLSVVGRLAQAHSFQVSLRPSAYAGVRAVLVVPRELITTVPVPSDTVPGLSTLSASVVRPAAPVPARKKAEDNDAELNAYGLPQRRRHNPAAPLGAGIGAERTNGSAPVPRQAPAPAPAAPPPPGLWLAAFQDAVSGERPAPAPSGPSGDETSNTEGEQS
jgi:signal transduction histidine kinase